MANLDEPSNEVTVRNTQVTFLLDELASFLGYKRPMAAFPNLSLSEVGRPTKAEVFRMMLGRAAASFLTDHTPDPMLLRRPEEAHY